MKQFCTFSLCLFITAICFSCGQSFHEKIPSQDIESEAIKQQLSDSTGGDKTEITDDAGERRFIRTASLRFKVRSVEETVSDIEIKSRILGGFVSLSHLNNSVQDSAVIALSPDSSLQTIQYGKDAVLIVRVPDYRLDSLLDHFSSLSDVMLNREISSEDVRIRILANRLARQRLAKINHRLTTDIDQKGKKLSELEQAEKTLEEKNELADHALISNLTLNDAVNYSTVSIEIYQDPVKICKHVTREKISIGYQQPFSSQLGDSFSAGWQIIKDLLISLTQYWSVFVLLAMGYFIFLKFFAPTKKLKSVGH